MILTLVALLLVAQLHLAGATPARAEAIRVTTDSAEYCDVLAQRYATSPQPGAEPARTLAEEGRRLCETGHVRTGIAKLRRALRAATNATN